MSKTIVPTTELAPAIRQLLDQLRRRIRAHVYTESVALALVLLGISFWATLGFDWLFEPPAPLRVVLLSLVGLALVYVLYRFLFRRIVVHLADRNMALLIERRYDQFQDSLLTVVELSDQPPAANDFYPEMLLNTQRRALDAAADVDIGRIFNTRPLARFVTLAALLIVSVLVFSLAASDVFGIWVRRSLLLSAENWPRRTRLVVRGFEDTDRIKVARGANVDLVVLAEAAPGRLIPQVVEVRYVTSDGARVRENMNREGVAVPGRDAYQQYAFTFKSLLTPIDFYVVGGDDRRGPMHLEVVDSPTIAHMTLHCEYPSYMRRAARDVAVSGLMQIPRGTRVTVRAESNKDLVRVQIDDQADEHTPLTHTIDLAAGRGPRRGFEFALPGLDNDKTLLFTLLDADGIHSRDPIRLVLNAMPDDPPDVGVQLRGIGTAITPNAHLPASGEIHDDYGIGRAWFDVQVDDSGPQQQPLQATVDGQQKVAVDEALEVGHLNLKPKQKLHWAVRAADTYDLTGTPNVGASQTYVLDVVTPQQLRGMLEARELMLRRRFETIIQELTDTRESLARIEFNGKSQASARRDSAGPTRDAGDAGAEPEDRADEPKAASPEQLAAARRVQTERALQNAERSAEETREVAVAFDDIRAELVNNRVDTEELKIRLKDGISDPLKRIADQMFPELNARLKTLNAQLEDLPRATTEAQTAALRQTDAILVEMKQVLDKMLELESFNEVLDLLRAVISAQEKINDETKTRQKDKLRDLLQ